MQWNIRSIAISAIGKPAKIYWQDVQRKFPPLIKLLFEFSAPLPADMNFVPSSELVVSSGKYACHIQYLAFKKVE